MEYGFASHVLLWLIGAHGRARRRADDRRVLVDGPRGVPQGLSPRARSDLTIDARCR